MILAALFLSTPLLLSGSGQPDPAFEFKIAVEQDGIHRIFFDELDYPGTLPDAAKLALFEHGDEIAIQVIDGGDGQFGPGDSLLFNGRHLRGEQSWYNEQARHNVYWLRQLDRAGRRFESGARLAETRDGKLPPARVRRHLEKDEIRVALAPSDTAEPAETWYWTRLSHLETRAFSLETDLGALPGEDPAVTIRAGFAGLSRDRHASQAGMAQHRVEMRLNGHPIAAAEWDGQESFEIEVERVDTQWLRPGANLIEIQVPRRTAPGDNAALIDVVLLNWIEVIRPFDGSLPDGRAILESPGEASLLPLISTAGEPAQVIIFSPSGRMIEFETGTGRAMSLDEPGRWHLVAAASFLSPAWIRPVVGQGDAWLDSRQADYLMITHPGLRQAVEPLAAYHRRQGLEVAVISVEDIYNRFSHGVETPQAIRDFIRHSRRHWPGPVARFVLLVGDAAWEQRGEAPSGRNLIPSLRVQAHDELAASDNGFVTLSDDDWRPALAIGRLPAAQPEELAAVVDKIISYQESAEPGPWRRNIAWITDRKPSFQEISNQLARSLSADGFVPTRVFPAGDDEAATHDQQALIQALNDGQLLVHFLGHGGRFVWRTGPPDYRDSRDLFSIADIEALNPRSELPMVLSMTCSSGPFDHPTADSIAEAFLRLPDRGAVAVLAASWRISASRSFSTALTAELTLSGATIGEAIMRAKQREPSRSLVESYNLLGDPAMRLSMPQSGLRLEAIRRAERVTVRPRSNLKQFLGGRVVIDWLDSAGHRLKTVESEVNKAGMRFHFELKPGEAQPSAAVVYAWKPDSRLDALGAVAIPE
jgi:hypothetical protein